MAEATQIDEDEREALEDLQNAWRELGIATKIPDIDDLKPRGPYELETEIGMITFDIFTVQDCAQSGLGVWGQNTEQILQRPIDEVKQILDEKFITPDWSEMTLEEFRRAAGFEVEVCIEYLVRWSGLVRKFREAEADQNGAGPKNGDPSPDEED